VQTMGVNCPRSHALETGSIERGGTNHGRSSEVMVTGMWGGCKGGGKKEVGKEKKISQRCGLTKIEVQTGREQKSTQKNGRNPVVQGNCAEKERGGNEEGKKKRWAR